MLNEIVLVFVFINTLIVGYLIGRFTTNNGVNNNLKSFFQNNQKETIKHNLSIDDKKIVVDIKTDGLEKKYDKLGDLKTTEDNISNSVNKLKNLKR
jgi:hypothetical protein